jgi:hypothetical protein
VMDDREKSDRRVLPVRLPNNAQGGAAEAVEGRRQVKGNAAGETRSGRSAGQSAPSGLDRVRRVARTDKEVRFTALLRHVDVDRLRSAYFALRPKAAPGVDGVTWHDYGRDLEANLRELHARVHRGSYRSKPGAGGQDSAAGGGQGAESRTSSVLVRVPAVDGEAPPVPNPDEGRTRRQSEPRSDGVGKPARVLSPKCSTSQRSASTLECPISPQASSSTTAVPSVGLRALLPRRSGTLASGSADRARLVVRQECERLAGRQHRPSAAGRHGEYQRSRASRRPPRRRFESAGNAEAQRSVAGTGRTENSGSPILVGRHVRDAGGVSSSQVSMATAFQWLRIDA